MIRVGNQFQWLTFDDDELVILYLGGDNKVIELPAKELVKRLQASLRQEDMFGDYED